jgi:glutathione reductase (NADPH)
MLEFDLIVIGAGSGGVRAARMAAAEGKSVALIEREFLGGTCVNVGCVPKKLFVYASHFAEEFEQAAGFGWQQEKPAKFDWQSLIENKNKEIERLNGIYGSMLKSAGVNLFWGDGRFDKNRNIEVVTKDKGRFTLSAAKTLVVVGCKPFVPDIPGAELAITSNDAFYLPELPHDILIVGGGYIAVEFAGIFNGLGVNTTLLYRGDTILRHFDHEIGVFIDNQMREKGIDIALNRDITGLAKQPDGRIEVEFNDGAKGCFGAVMYATGRTPVFDNLGLEHTRVSFSKSGKIAVNQYFETDEPGVFALGDIIDGPELTPVALAEATAFVSTQYKGIAKQVTHQNIPTAVFCQPNIGTVGLSEAEARETFEQIRVFKSEFRHLKHTLSGSSERTFMKLVVNAENDQVIGAHMVGADAGEIIQGLGIAVKAGLTKADWDDTIGIHPTAAEEFVTMRTAESES